MITDTSAWDARQCTGGKAAQAPHPESTGLVAASTPIDGRPPARERPILFSVTTGEPSKRGQRLKSNDGLTWKQRNREAVNERRRDLYAADAEKHRQRASDYRQKARDKVLSYNREWSAGYRARLRSEMLVAYGSRCKCCHEQEPLFLQLDHVENDGHLDRKAHRTSNKLLAHLKRAGWPQDRYQLLCANCNFGKLLNGGVCPHQQQAEALRA